MTAKATTPSPLTKVADALVELGWALHGLAESADGLTDSPGAIAHLLFRREGVTRAREVEVPVAAEVVSPVASVETLPPPRPAPARPRKTVGPAARGGKRWTPERLAILREFWPTYMSRDEIVAKLVAAGGPDLPAAHIIGIYAARTLGLKRPSDFLRTALRHGPAPTPARPVDAPPPSETKIVAPNISIDQRLSVAARIEADELAQQAACPITWSDALEWGKRHRPDGVKTPTTLAEINAVRAHHGLPRYRIIRARGPENELPAANVGDTDLTPEGNWRSRPAPELGAAQ